jgi:hypothetical protein
VKTLTDKTPRLRLVGGFPGKSPPRTTSFRPARGVSARMTSFCPARGVSASHDTTPPRPIGSRPTQGLHASHENFSPCLRQLTRASSFRLRLRRSPTRTWPCPDDRAPPPTHTPRNNTQGSSSPRHANAPAGGPRGRLALTGTVMLHRSPARLPMCRPIRPLQHANPVKST